MTTKKEQTIPEKSCTHEACCKLIEDEIRADAYDRFAWRCESHEPGSALDDWLSAERAVLARHGVKPAAPASAKR